MSLRHLAFAVSLVVLLCLPGVALATHIHFESYADVAAARFDSTDDSWSYTFSLTDDVMSLWEIASPTLENGPFDPADSFLGSYDPSAALHYVYLRIDPNNYFPQGTSTSSYVGLTVNGVIIGDWANPIPLYEWGVPWTNLEDPYGIAGNDFTITVTLTGLEGLSSLTTKRLPLEITNVNIEGCFEEAAPVPEPSTLLLLGGGLMGLFVWRRKNY